MLVGLAGVVGDAVEGVFFWLFFASSVDPFLVRSAVAGAPKNDLIGAYASATNLSIVASTVLVGGGVLVERLGRLGLSTTPSAHIPALCLNILAVIQVHSLFGSAMTCKISKRTVEQMFVHKFPLFVGSSESAIVLNKFTGNFEVCPH